MLRLRAFGGLTLERDGLPITGGAAQRRRLALLALLAATADVGTGRERLAVFLWPDVDTAHGRHSLDDALSALRHELGTSLFVGVATLRLNPHLIASDVSERAGALRDGDLERAVALYAGPFLDGFGIPGTAELEHWIARERARRHDEQVRALEHLAIDATSRGDVLAAVHWWSERVALDPFDSRATRRLLDAHLASGNGAEALEVARVHETLVMREFEVTPGPEWKVAVDRLRRSLRPVHAAPPHAGD